MGHVRKVFCGHRQVDRLAVEAFARRLRDRGIDARFDEWGFQPGDDFGQRIQNGLADYDVGLVFFSSAQWPGTWFDAEVSTIGLFQGQRGRRLIPVMLDDLKPLLPPLKRYARRSAEDFEQILGDILGHFAKPPLTPNAAQPQRLQFTLRLTRGSAGTFCVEALRNGDSVARQEGVIVNPALRPMFEALPRRDLNDTPREAAQGLAGLRADDMQTLGDQLARTLCPGAVGAALGQALQAVSTASTLDLCLESEDPVVLSLPFEALRVEGRVPALMPGVSMRRCVTGAPAGTWHAVPSPLKILVAVGAPDEGQMKNSVLDLELELQSILDAVEPHGQQASAEARFLEVAHPHQIVKALRQDAYHVLHLSGHGGPASIELEDEDGASVIVTAAELARHLQGARHKVPLVFLSSCFGATPSADACAMASDLVRAGVPFVLAMQAGVTDRYASALARALYAALSERENPQPAQALAMARQALEEARQQALLRGSPLDQTPADYATAALYCAGDDAPLVDFAAPREPLAAPSAHQTVGRMSKLDVGALVGRRRELRDVLRVLRDHPASVAAHGRLGGVVLTGVGGVGKSAVAGRAMARLQEEGWAVAAVAGRLSLGSLCAAVAVALNQHANPSLARAGRLPGDIYLDDFCRLGMLFALLQHAPLLLVLDNFEDNLTPGGLAFHDEAVCALLGQLAANAQHGRLLITCRYPLPGLEGAFHHQNVPPLSPVEVRKLLWRLESFKGLDGADVAEVTRQVGGHPRMLEFLDGLLRHGAARLPDLTHRLHEAVLAAGMDPNPAPADLSDAVRHTALRVARTVLLDELLTVARAQGDEEALRQLAVSALPMSAAELVQALTGAPGAQEEIQAMSLRLERLVSLSLGRRLPQGYWVDRWTAEALAQSASLPEQQARCRLAGEFRLARIAERGFELDDHCEATYNFLGAAEFDRACAFALEIASPHVHLKQHITAVTFAADVLRHLPHTAAGRDTLADLEAQRSSQPCLTDQSIGRTCGVADVLELRARQAPKRAKDQRELSVVYSKMGDLMSALGQGEQARAFFEQDLAIAERLAEAEPGQANYQRDLSVSYSKMGDLMSALGQGEQARAFLEKDLAIIQRLAEAEPGWANYQRDLSVSYSKLGDLTSGLGQREQARPFFEESLAIRKRLVEADPGRPDYQRELSVSYNKLGDLLIALGQREQACGCFEQSLAIRMQLDVAEPGLADHLRAVSMLYDKLGDLMSELGKGEQERECFEKSLAIAQWLAEAEPERSDYQRDLCVLLGRYAFSQGSEGVGLAMEAAARARQLRDTGRLSSADSALIEALDDLVETLGRR